MKLRSLLFVPADSERKFAKADTIGADALILDLEDSVAPGRKAIARALRLGAVGRRKGDAGRRRGHRPTQAEPRPRVKRRRSVS